MNDFTEWLRAPIADEFRSQRIEVRRACPSDFDRIYDLIDRAFGSKRHRSHNDWLYRRNPSGLARCWIAVSRDTGELVGSHSSFPWPLARGLELLDGAVSGDLVTAPEWQRQGIYGYISTARDSHPWHNQAIFIGWPNEKSLGLLKKHGRAHRIMGQLERRIAILHLDQYLNLLGWPRSMAEAGGVAGDFVSRGWQKIFLKGRALLVIEEVRRFDSDYDKLTQRCMSWPGFWCPHNADFLNWRYMDHPSRHYAALAMIGPEGLSGYSVVRFGGGKALLMEFVVPQTPPRLSRSLLYYTLNMAREADCRHLEFFAPSSWQHWRLFRYAGFLRSPHALFIEARRLDQDEPLRLENFRLVPGDSDVF